MLKNSKIPKKTFIKIIVFLILVLGGAGVWYYQYQLDKAVVDFDSCVKRTGIILTSYPAQCVHNGKSYTEKIDSQKGE